MSTATTVPGRASRLRLGGAIPIWVYNVLLAAGGFALWFGVVRHLGRAPAAHLGVPWWTLVLGFYLTEAYVVHVHFRSEAHTISLNEVALVLGFYLISPGTLVLTYLAGAGTALVFHRRQRPVKLVFNLALFAVTTSVALIVFRAVAKLGDPFGPAGWAGALTATVVASMLGVVLVTGVITIAEGKLDLGQVPITAAISLVATVATTNMALIAIELGKYNPRAFVLLAIPAAIVVFGFRSFVGQRRRHEHLEFLYQSMKATQGAPEYSLAIGQLLITARHLVRAEYAEILLLPTADEPALRSSLGSLGEMLSHADDVAPADAQILEEVRSTGDLLLLPSRRPPSTADGYLAARNLPDAMITTLRGETGPFGLLVVGDRSGDVDTFSEDDSKLLQTFAGHASVLLENGRLERTLADVTELQDQLRHQAFHDTLTSLPNRALLAERVMAAMADPTNRKTVAVMFLDLDDFKAINDSRGHAVGDQLLSQVADRVRACVRPDDTPARLGGDEFAVLLQNTTRKGAELAAMRLVRSFDRPFELEGRQTYVHTSIGIALGESSRSADELLRNADVAMYAAKAGGKKQLAVYEPSMHAGVQRRHEFSLDLEHSTDRGEIAVLFQPIVSLRTGETLSFEALARWHHPRLGVIEPGEFIAIAEQNGMMEKIGKDVLQQACRSAKRWQEAHPAYAGIGVAVNLSPSQLTSERLLDDVARVLVESKLGSDRLTLEITESAAMHDIDFVSDRLTQLRALGIKLALDDFGTGHSSLERLDVLPLNLLKIAKPFTDRLLDTTSDTSFIDAFVRLAHSLEMECIAEGIEHEIQVPRLLDRGCGLGQGFHFAVPLTMAGVLDYLDSRRLIGSGA